MKTFFCLRSFLSVRLQMNNDEIVSDILSLIHSSTQTNYVLCSEISSKIFSYFERIQYKDNQWTELNQAIQVKSFFFEENKSTNQFDSLEI